MARKELIMISFKRTNSILFIGSLSLAIIYLVFRVFRIEFATEVLIGALVLHILYGGVNIFTGIRKNRYVALGLFVISLRFLFYVQHYPFRSLFLLIASLVYIYICYHLLNDFSSYKGQMKMVYIGIAALTSVLIPISSYVDSVNHFRDNIYLIHSFSLLFYLIDDKFKNETYKMMYIASVFPLVQIIQTYFY